MLIRPVHLVGVGTTINDVRLPRLWVNLKLGIIELDWKDSVSTFLTENHLFCTILAHLVGFLLGSLSQLCCHHDPGIRSDYDSLKLNFTPSTPLIIPQDMRRCLIRGLMKHHRSVDSSLHKPLARLRFVKVAARQTRLAHFYPAIVGRSLSVGDRFLAEVHWSLMKIGSYENCKNRGSED